MVEGNFIASSKRTRRGIKNVGAVKISKYQNNSTKCHCKTRNCKRKSICFTHWSSANSHVPNSFIFSQDRSFTTLLIETVLIKSLQRWISREGWWGCSYETFSVFCNSFSWNRLLHVCWDGDVDRGSFLSLTYRSPFSIKDIFQSCDHWFRHGN